jgi:hypothetical protein
MSPSGQFNDAIIAHSCGYAFRVCPAYAPNVAPIMPVRRCRDDHLACDVRLAGANGVGVQRSLAGPRPAGLRLPSLLVAKLASSAPSQPGCCYRVNLCPVGCSTKGAVGRKAHGWDPTPQRLPLARRFRLCQPVEAGSSTMVNELFLPAVGSVTIPRRWHPCAWARVDGFRSDDLAIGVEYPARIRVRV